MAVKKTTARKRKKNWYEMVSPDVLDNRFIGESLLYEAKDLMGKTIKVNLSTLLNDMKKQGIDAGFKVVSIKDNKGITEFTGIYHTNSSMKRIVRRGRDKIEDSFLAKTKNGKTIRIKPIIITSSKTSNSAISMIRGEAKKTLMIKAKSMNHDAFFKELIHQKTQKEIKDALSKIYPLRFVDVRQAYLEDPKLKKVEEVPDEEPAPQKTQEEAVKEEPAPAETESK